MVPLPEAPHDREGLTNLGVCDQYTHFLIPDGGRSESGGF